MFSPTALPAGWYPSNVRGLHISEKSLNYNPYLFFKFTIVLKFKTHLSVFAFFHTRNGTRGLLFVFSKVCVSCIISVLISIFILLVYCEIWMSTQKRHVYIGRIWKYPCWCQISPYWSRLKSLINMENSDPDICLMLATWLLSVAVPSFGFHVTPRPLWGMPNLLYVARRRKFVKWDRGITLPGSSVKQ